MDPTDLSTWTQILDSNFGNIDEATVQFSIENLNMNGEDLKSKITLLWIRLLKEPSKYREFALPAIHYALLLNYPDSLYNVITTLIHTLLPLITTGSSHLNGFQLLYFKSRYVGIGTDQRSKRAKTNVERFVVFLRDFQNNWANLGMLKPRIDVIKPTQPAERSFRQRSRQGIVNVIDDQSDVEMEGDSPTASPEYMDQDVAELYGSRYA